MLAFGKIAFCSVGLNLQWVIDAFIGPQATHRDHTIVDLAQVGQVLPADVGRLMAILAISRFIYHQNPTLIGRS